MNGMKFIRSYLYISSESLAEMLGVSRSLVSMWENGKKPIPEGRKEKIAEIFGVPKDELDELTEEKQLEIMKRDIYYNLEGDYYSFSPEYGTLRNASMSTSGSLDEADQFHAEAEFRKELNEYYAAVRRDCTSSVSVVGSKQELLENISRLEMYKSFTELMYTKYPGFRLNQRFLEIVLITVRHAFGISDEESQGVQAAPWFQDVIKKYDPVMVDFARDVLRAWFGYLADLNISQGHEIDREEYVESRIEKYYKQMNVKTRTISAEDMKTREEMITDWKRRFPD